MLLATWTSAFSLRANLRALVASPPSQLGGLHGLRAFGLLFVMTTHAIWIGVFRPSAPPGDVEATFTDPLLRFLGRGEGALDVYFVLSGFLIMRLLDAELEARGGVNLGRFYARRAMRLFPTYFVCLGLVALIAPDGVGTIWANFLFVNNYVSISHSFMPWTWSVAVEEQFYFLAPFVLLAAARRRRQLAGWLVAAFVAFVAIRALAVVQSGLRLPFIPHPRAGVEAYQRYFDGIHQPTHARVGAIVWGMFIHEVAGPGWVAWWRARPRLAGVAFAACVALLVGFALVPAFTTGAPWPAAASTAYLTALPYAYAIGAGGMIGLLVDARLVPGVHRVMSMAPARLVSNLAYPAYLVHPIVMFAAYATLLDRPVLGYGLRLVGFLVMFAVTLLLATILHLGLEKPLMRLRPGT